MSLSDPEFAQIPCFISMQPHLAPAPHPNMQNTQVSTISASMDLSSSSGRAHRCLMLPATSPHVHDASWSSHCLPATCRLFCAIISELTVAARTTPTRVCCLLYPPCRNAFAWEQLHARYFSPHVNFVFLLDRNAVAHIVAICRVCKTELTVGFL